MLLNVAPWTPGTLLSKAPGMVAARRPNMRAVAVSVRAGTNHENIFCMFVAPGAKSPDEMARAEMNCTEAASDGMNARGSAATPMAEEVPESPRVHTPQ